MAFGPFWQLNVAVAAGSLALLLGLAYVYGRNLKDLRSPFTIGLFAFAGLFLAQSVLSILVYVSMADQNEGSNVAVPMLALNVAGLAGFAALFLATWR
ncbi:MAG TPA: hypothetical protein VJ326_05365 [Thermoplasmata archaeon]|jgi:hypothetical protein|nr:hypothetical protein [Thermoplasmata archaeon]